MQYLGSKNRIAKQLAPIIQSYITDETEAYIEPFVGGANMIDKISHHTRIGYDIHTQLVALLNYVKNTENELPESISRKQYDDVRSNFTEYEDWYVGLVGFCGSFGAKFFNSYASGTDKRDRASEAINNIQKQRHKLSNIEFINGSYHTVSEVNNCVIYCDPPYRNTTKYKTDTFNYEAFYGWAIEMSKENTLLISEYWMPEDRFECIWEQETSVNFAATRKGSNKRVERLYKPKQ